MNQVSGQKESFEGNPILFVKEVAKYFMDFLETDFHKRRFPKRSIKLKNEDNLQIGLNLHKYPSFCKLAWKAVNHVFNSDIIKHIEKGAYRTNIPNNLLDVIKLQVGKITNENLSSVMNRVVKDVEDNARLFKDDLDKALTTIFDNASKDIFQDLVLPFVNNLVKPIETLEVGDEDTIFSMEEELTAVLLKMVEDKITQLVKELIVGNRPDVLSSLKEIFRLKDVRSKIIDFFENFKVNDVFAELFDMDRNKGILDKQEFYFYFCDITFNKAKYPIFYIPFDIVKEHDSLTIQFDSEIYINKKALEYIAQEYNTYKGTRGNLKTIAERIIYLSQHKDDFVDVIQKIVSEISNFFQLNSTIDLKNSKKQIAKSLVVKVSNSCYFCLFDKSDEALVNDYEEMLEKMSESEDGELSNGFIELINDFIQKEPVSFNRLVEDEWGSIGTSDKLVYASPVPLNSEQRQILLALGKKDCRYATVEGPPGTGKSHTITAIVCDAILKDKSVLVLSDKKEALDVVEDKITETMNHVRMDKNFQNPILRLGKAGNTYSQILSTASIENIKTHYKVARQNASDLKERIDKHSNTLKEDIDSEILFYNKIHLRDIHEIINLDLTYKGSDLVFDFNEVHVVPNGSVDLRELRNHLLMIQEEFLKVENENIISGFLKLSANDFSDCNDFLEFLKSLLKIRNIIEKLRVFFKEKIKALNDFNEFSDKSFEVLENFIKRYENLKNKYFGYLFKWKEVEGINNNFKEVFPYVSYANPSKSLGRLKEICTILNYSCELKKELSSNITKRIDYLKLLHSCLIEQKNFAKLEDIPELIETVEEITGICKKYKKTAEINKIDLSKFSTLMQNKLTDISEAEFARQIAYLNLKRQITRNFNDIPQIDYVKQTKNLEELVTAQMTYVMDERAIDFYENSRNTAKSLREIIKNKQRFPRNEFDKLKEAFPCILAGIRDYAEFIPLEPNIFDLLVIDEASQVSIAQAFPALLRAKKIVIFGDRKQFSNIKAAHARSDANREYLNRLGSVFQKNVSTDPTKLARLGKFNIRTSILEFFEFVTNFRAQLMKHFRGYKELISYSNKYFYKNTLQVMKIRGKLIDEVLKFTIINHDGQVDPILNTNSLEVINIIAELNKLREDNVQVTVGIITPHTNQQKLLMEEISRLKDRDYFFDTLKLKIMTFDTCQGEERDVIFYSMVATREMDRLWGVFIKDLQSIDIEGEDIIKVQRLNVGFSRAKERMHFILSKQVDEFKGAIGEALRHYATAIEEAKKERSMSEVDDKSPKEKEVLHWFYQTEFWNKNKDNIGFFPQFRLGEYLKQLDISYVYPKYVVDFLLVYRDPKAKNEYKVIIEYDGFSEHFKNINDIDRYNYGEYYTDGDVYRQKVLMGYGYKFLRINKFNIGENPIETLNKRILGLLNGQVEQTEFLKGMHEDIEGLQNGSKKECPRCENLRDIEEFRDNALISGVSRYCKQCKTGKKKEETKSAKKEIEIEKIKGIFAKSTNNNFKLVTDAIANGKTLNIEYTSKYGRVTSRKIKPIAITGFLVKAHCYLRGDERTFNLNKMKIQNG
jgi:superfamily I DNA and/or RNA helicase/very-short-patch-repair endonuclease